MLSFYRKALLYKRGLNSERQVQEVSNLSDNWEGGGETEIKRKKTNSNNNNNEKDTLLCVTY